MTLEDQNHSRPFVNLINEFGMLSRLPRSGFSFLGTGKQSVAEHSFGVISIAFVLAHCCEETVDELRLLQLCLLHDLPESRIGDHNYVQKEYLSTNDSKVFKDIKEASPLGGFIVGAVEEFEELKTLEALLARDADHLELLITLKKEIDTGNPRAADWFDLGEKRLHTLVAKRLAQGIRITPFDEWWLKGVIKKQPESP
ncbi:MAG: putative hydrolase of HD superfamily [Chlamydiales bacterium]|jgi:putative hydrolase of HD superfamily